MIVFFDGECNLCNTSVDFLIRHDKKGLLKFASLQGETAKEKLPPEKIQDLDTMLLFSSKGISEKSKAWFQILEVLGKPWSILLLFKVLPTPACDWIYDLIAANRHRVFGKRETCRLPTPEEKAYFLK